MTLKLLLFVKDMQHIQKFSIYPGPRSEAKIKADQKGVPVNSLVKKWS